MKSKKEIFDDISLIVLGTFSNDPDASLIIAQQKLYDYISNQVEVGVMLLQDIADTLAMDCLQSTRYQTDPNFKKKVDDTLYLTRDWS